jgi:Domain of unknown function (DUF4258)
LQKEEFNGAGTFFKSWPNAAFSNKRSGRSCSAASPFAITRKIAPFPSTLFLGYTGGKPLHVVASCDEINRRAFVITAYEPSKDVFESDYRTRKKL